eukprot:GSChrysophyteH2.ASY1.ANO1.435.1 assembled CDS
MFTTNNDFGYIIALSVAMFLQQQVGVIVSILWSLYMCTVRAPTLYPRDSEIKALKLTDEQVNDYYCCQRAHQNNVEFTSVFFPLFLLAGLLESVDTMSVTYAGACVCVCVCVC